MNNKEWSGVMFFKMTSGSLEKPESIVLEVIDFFLMDIGSGAFTSTSYEESGGELADYQMANPHTMDEGVRIGYAHSHHNMSTFYSTDDVDDLVVNTRDKNVDYYVTLIMNNMGDWISRLAFRIEETIEEKVDRKFWSSAPLLNSWKDRTKRSYTEPVLVMVPLEVVQEHYDNSSIERFKVVNDRKSAKTRELAKRFEGDAYQLGGRPGKAVKVAKEFSDLQEEMNEDVLMGRLMTASLSFSGGLDMAVKAFNREYAAPDGNPYEELIKLHADAICANAMSIIEIAEGGSVSVSYVVEVLMDLIQHLIQDYIDYDKQDEVLPENRAVDELTDILDDILNNMVEEEHTLDARKHGKIKGTTF